MSANYQFDGELHVYPDGMTYRYTIQANPDFPGHYDLLYEERSAEIEESPWIMISSIRGIPLEMWKALMQGINLLEAWDKKGV